jgi:hypothetical protein
MSRGQDPRLGDPACIGVAAVVALLLAIAAVSVWWRAVTPSDQTRINMSGTWVSGDRIITRADGAPGGLRQGDEIVAVDGRTITSWVEMLPRPDTHRPTAEVGTTLVYRVRRAGGSLDVAVTLRPYPWVESMARNWSRLLLIVVQLSLAALIFVRRPKDPAARAAVLIASLATAGAATSWVFDLEVYGLVMATGLWRYVGGQALFTDVGSPAPFHPGVPPAPIGRRPPPMAERARVRRAIRAARPAPEHHAALGAGDHRADRRVDLVHRSRRMRPPSSALIYGYRSANDGETRQRLRWVAITLGTGSVIYTGIWIAPPFVFGLPRCCLPSSMRWCSCPSLLHSPPRSSATTRSTSWSIVSWCMAASPHVWPGLHFVTVGLVGMFLHHRSGLAAAALATGLVAVTAQPLRDRLQRGVNRLRYGDRDDPYALISRLSLCLEVTPTPEATLPMLVETVGRGLRLPYTAIERQHRDSAEPAAVYGQPVTGCVRLPLRHQGETIGWLVLGPRGPSDAFSPTDDRLFQDLARHAGIAAHTVRLTADLQRSRESCAPLRRRSDSACAVISMTASVPRSPVSRSGCTQRAAASRRT